MQKHLWKEVYSQVHSAECLAAVGTHQSIWSSAHTILLKKKKEKQHSNYPAPQPPSQKKPACISKKDLRLLHSHAALAWTRLPLCLKHMFNKHSGPFGWLPSRREGTVKVHVTHNDCVSCHLACCLFNLHQTERYHQFQSVLWKHRLCEAWCMSQPTMPAVVIIVSIYYEEVVHLTTFNTLIINYSHKMITIGNIFA